MAFKYGPAYPDSSKYGAEGTPNDGPSDDQVSFSGPGPADISNPRGGGTQVETPVFFRRAPMAPEDELTPGTVETPREEAMRVDAVSALKQSQEANAPKV